MTELLDVERRLALFAQAITGSAYEVRATDTFSGSSALLHADAATLDARALYLPARLATDPSDTVNTRSYRLLSLHQLGYREFGTFEFRLAQARAQSPALRKRPAPAEPLRESDLDAFYNHFDAPTLARALFRLLEAHRIDTCMLAAYPGVRDDHRQAMRTELNRRSTSDQIVGLRDLLEAVQCWSLGAPESALVARDTTGALAHLLTVGATVTIPGADVHATADAVVAGYAAIQRCGLISAEIAVRLTTADPEGAEFDLDRPAVHGNPPDEWLQREARLADWDEELAGLDAKLATHAIQGEAEAGDAGVERPPGMEVRQLTDQRDTLARRIEIESNNIRHALGRSGRPNGTSFLYDEWDAVAGRYLRGWCRLYECRGEPGDGHAVTAMLTRIAPLQQRVRRQFQQLPQQAFARTRRVLDGEELDWDQVLDLHTDRRRRITPDERIYQRRDRVVRDVAAAFLIDLSASTDDAVNKPPVDVAAAAEADDDPLLWEPAPIAADAVSPRRIIDVLRDSIALMARALDSHGDRFGIYGFSGYGRDNVEYYVAKEINEPLSGSTLRALAGMRPRRSTRMGPAIRHSTRKLTGAGSTLKVLIMLSDGFPQDCDYGPDRSDHDYGVADTAQALAEAARAGVQTFCLTVDKSGHDYLKQMCPDDRYLIIEDIEALPDALAKVYQKLTA